ncbi:MAG: hypothetical protein OXU40_07795, partial [Nitrospira sp.]|nr:hypothetical protein [Nitrospira sp.]
NDGGGGRAINRDDQALPSGHIHHHHHGNPTLGQRLPLTAWIPASAGMTEGVAGPSIVMTRPCLRATFIIIITGTRPLVNACP